VDVRLANYLDQAQQKWTITAVTNASGSLGSPYFKITVAGTDRVLSATEDGELLTLTAFTGGPEQLWRIDQLADGNWRFMTKPSPRMKDPFSLSAIGSSFATLSKFNPDSDTQRWLLKTP
jgi:arabinan endo-1,5-alpha-L-arabinosidase